MRVIDVEVYEPDELGGQRWAQARYLVHGHDDVLWTDDVDEALAYVRAELVAP